MQQEFSWQDELRKASLSNRTIFSTSFSIEDQVITDFIADQKLSVDIFTIDTGRLPSETYQVWQRTVDKYQIKISAYYPHQDSIEKFVTTNGINPFYVSKEMRLQCCNIRKIEPLKRALYGYELWISGIRREHSSGRGQKNFYERDESLSIIKFYPLLEMKEGEVWEIIKNRNIPYNELYNKGYRSIGCDPCSRAIKEGDDIRSGRWWWESDEAKECGLHMVGGKMVRSKSPS